MTPFTEAQLGLGAERTVDADTLDALRGEVDRQEAVAGRAGDHVADHAADHTADRAPDRAAGQVTP